MRLSRRKLLNRVVVSGSIGLAGCGLFADSCDVACFEFFHEGFDDAPDWLTIMHTEGQNLPAEEVFITNVIVEDGPYKEWVTDTVAWHEVAENTDPTDGIKGQSVRVDIGYPDAVQVLWRHENEEQVLDETRDLQ